PGLYGVIHIAQAARPCGGVAAKIRVLACDGVELFLRPGRKDDLNVGLASASPLGRRTDTPRHVQHPLRHKIVVRVLQTHRLWTHGVVPTTELADPLTERTVRSHEAGDDHASERRTSELPEGSNSHLVDRIAILSRWLLSLSLSRARARRPGCG